MICSQCGKAIEEEDAVYIPLSSGIKIVCNECHEELERAILGGV